MLTTNQRRNSEAVPIKYIDDAPENKRLSRMKKLFGIEFKSNPSFYVRVPGRVNIIGEHIDYCGYPVLPMALEQNFSFAVEVTDNLEIHLRNTDPKYSNYDGHVVDEELNNLDTTGAPNWYDYVLCGFKGAKELINGHGFKGLNILIDGNILSASGLSSSSALVSAAVLTFLHAHNVSMTKTEIADLCARSERFIGTQGGGMDQAIAFLAEKNSAQYITWSPLTATPIILPSNISFVVAHSLTEANKAATNDFNRRVVECRLAAKLLALKNNIKSTPNLLRLCDVQKILNKTLEEMLELVLNDIQLNVYTREDVYKTLNISEEELDNVYLTNNTKHLTEFNLKQRAIHVYSEALRVERFKEACVKYNSDISTGTDYTRNKRSEEDVKGMGILNELGKYMRESHASLEQLYECSHPELDRLVQLSDDYGVHARLTGAGWGGCVVALCHHSITAEYIEFLKENFYNNHPGLKDKHVDKVIFATTPNQGAEIYI